MAAVGYGDADAAFAVDGIERGGGAENDAALAADGVEAIGEQVGEDLAQLAGDAHDVEPVIALLGDDGPVGLDLCLEQIDDGIHQGAGGVAGGGGELAIEAEGLAGDVGDAHELAVRDIEVLAGVVGKGGVGADDVEGVHDRFERIVDLVGDAGGHAASAGEHFTAQQGLFRFFAGGVVGADEEIADDGVLGIAQGSDGDDGGEARCRPCGSR